MRVAVAVFVLSGCGRVAFDARSDAGSASDDATSDARIVRWGTPRVLGEIGGVGDSSPSITADLLTIVWTSDRTGGLGGADIWTATRATPTSPFMSFTNLASINSSADEYSPEISPDGTRLYFNSSRTDSGDLFTAQGGGTTWSAPVNVAGLPTAGYQGDLGVTPDGLLVVYHDSGNFYRASRGDTGSAFGAITQIPEGNIDPDIAAPSVGAGGDVIYFHAGTVRDLYRMRWTGSAYSTPEPVTELNTPQRDADPFINGDETYMLYDCNGEICETTPE